MVLAWMALSLTACVVAAASGALAVVAPGAILAAGAVRSAVEASTPAPPAPAGSALAPLARPAAAPTVALVSWVGASNVPDAGEVAP
jgi:hypothetical protein